MYDRKVLVITVKFDCSKVQNTGTAVLLRSTVPTSVNDNNRYPLLLLSTKTQWLTLQ